MELLLIPIHQCLHHIIYFHRKKRKCVADMFLNRNFASIHLLGLEITVLIKSLVLIKITSIVSCIYRHLKNSNNPKSLKY